MGSISSKTTSSCSGLISEHSDGGLHRLSKNRYCRGKVSGCVAADGRAGSRLAMSKKAWTVGSKYVLHEVPSRFLAFVPSPFFFHLHPTFYPCLFSPDLSSDFLCVSFLVTHREPFTTQVWSPSTDVAVVLANSQSSLCFPFCGNCHEIDSSISSCLSLSLSLSASLTGLSCGANNIRPRRPEYWQISSFSISNLLG